MKPSVPVPLFACPKGPGLARRNCARSKSDVPSGDFARGQDRLLRRREVQHVTGLSRSSLYRLIASGRFPSPIQLSENAVGWLASEIGAWVAGRVAASRKNTVRSVTAPEGL